MTILPKYKVTKIKKLELTKNSKKCHYSKQQICNFYKYLIMMETTLIFALSNQFLVWVAKKVFVQSDLDLVLTKSYKERLES